MSFHCRPSLYAQELLRLDEGVAVAMTRVGLEPDWVAWYWAAHVATRCAGRESGSSAAYPAWGPGGSSSKAGVSARTAEPGRLLPGYLLAERP